MTSSFLALESVNGRPGGWPAKVSFSGREWCGNVYQGGEEALKKLRLSLRPPRTT